jgi:Uncharacterized protein conserved in bacteria (DUF2171)
MTSGDPVSWFLIEPGWKVIEANGKDAGLVEEVVGDANADIFNGLSISVGLLKGHRYVPSEQVSRIIDGEVQLRLTRDELDSLEKYEQPAVSEQILPPNRER